MYIDTTTAAGPVSKLASGAWILDPERSSVEGGFTRYRAPSTSGRTLMLTGRKLAYMSSFRPVNIEVAAARLWRWTSS
jgi:hypothetical protein